MPLLLSLSKKEKDRFEISEMFMAKADKNRCFFGCIKRLKDENGNPFVFCRIKMKDGLLCASANDQKILYKNLDEMCVMIMIKDYIPMLASQPLSSTTPFSSTKRTLLRTPDFLKRLRPS